MVDRKKFASKSVQGGVQVTDRIAGNRTLMGLRELRQRGSLCDVRLKIEGSIVCAHRNVLCVHSDYFRAMFLHGFQEIHSSDIELPDYINKEAAESLIDFMYTGNFTVTNNNVQDLIVVADQWQLVVVKEICEEYMEANIEATNCLGILGFADYYNCERLQNKCIHLLKQRFNTVIKLKEFLTIPVSRLEQILNFDDLSLGHKGEDEVLESVMLWVNHDLSKRREHVPHLLQQVKLSSMSKEGRQKLEKWAVMLDMPELQNTIEIKLSQPKETRKARSTLYVIGGFLQSRSGPKSPRTKTVECLLPASQKWNQVVDFPALSSGSVALNIYGHLFCFAYESLELGHARSASESSVFEFNFIRGEWRNASDNFSEEVLKCINDCLQASGAVVVCSRTETIFTVSHSEVAYIPVRLKDGEVICRDVRLLPIPHNFFGESQSGGHSAIVSHGRLFVLGGDKKTAGLDVVPSKEMFMYDPDERKWIQRADLLEGRIKMDVAELDGYIYACGGFNARRLSSMEQYNPKTNTWARVASMAKYRSHHKLVALDNKLWAIGGKSYAVNNGGARKVLNLCEVYDPNTDTWTEGESMKFARCGFAAVVV